MSTPTSPKVWFVTGSSSGIGRLTVEAALRSGDSVVATLRKPSVLASLQVEYPPERLLVLPLDVSSASQISDAFKRAAETFGRIDVVVNNAGYYFISDAEGVPEDQARKMFDTVFWGAANVTREAIRVFRDVNGKEEKSGRGIGGRLLQMSSRTAVSPQAGSIHYAAAKAALEALSDGYATELDPAWNIKISCIEPGLFHTSAPANSTMLPPHPAYTSPSLPVTQYRALYNHPDGIEHIFTGDPAKLAQLMLRLADLADPPARLPVHAVSLAAVRHKGEGLVKTVDEYASWSDDVYLEGVEVKEYKAGEKFLFK